MTDWHSSGKANILEKYQCKRIPQHFQQGAFIEFALTQTIQGALLVSKHVMADVGYHSLARGSALNLSLAINPSHDAKGVLPVVATRLHSVPSDSEEVTRVCELVKGRLTPNSRSRFDELKCLTFKFDDCNTGKEVTGWLSKSEFGVIAHDMADYKVTAIVRISPWEFVIDKVLEMERTQ